MCIYIIFKILDILSNYLDLATRLSTHNLGVLRMPSNRHRHIYIYYYVHTLCGHVDMNYIRHSTHHHHVHDIMQRQRQRIRVRVVLVLVMGNGSGCYPIVLRVDAVCFVLALFFGLGHLANELKGAERGIELHLLYHGHIGREG